MIYCTQCGHAAEPGVNYCPKCGKRLAADTNTQASTLLPEAEPAGEFAQQQPQRNCTKCGVALEPDILFCPACGTKNYVFQPNKTKKGELLIELTNCNLMKLQLIKNPGVLYLYDDKLFFKANSPANNIVIPYSDLATVTGQSGFGTKYGVRLSSIGGKNYQFSLPECYADLYYYVINLILDYRQQGVIS